MAHALDAWAITEREKSRSVTYSTDLDYYEVLRKLCVNTHCIKLNEKISAHPHTFIMYTVSDPNSLCLGQGT